MKHRKNALEQWTSWSHLGKFKIMALLNQSAKETKLIYFVLKKV